MKVFYRLSLTIILVWASLVVLPFLLFFLSVLFQSSPSKPDIEKAEFSFALSYEINDQEKIIEDVIICEFDGFENFETGGKWREWKSYLKSTGEAELIFLDFREKKNFFEEKRDEFIDWIQGIVEFLTATPGDSSVDSILYLYFKYGYPEYYMGEPGAQIQSNGAQEMDIIYYAYRRKDGVIEHSSMSADEAHEKYGIRLISWECDPPIKNTFK